MILSRWKKCSKPPENFKRERDIEKKLAEAAEQENGDSSAHAGTGTGDHGYAGEEDREKVNELGDGDPGVIPCMDCLFDRGVRLWFTSMAEYREHAAAYNARKHAVKSCNNTFLNRVCLRTMLCLHLPAAFGTRKIELQMCFSFFCFE